MGSKEAWPRPGSPGCWSPASLGAEAHLGLSQPLSSAGKRKAPNPGLQTRGKGKGLLYAPDCPHDCPGTKRGLTLPLATSLHPAVLATQPHLAGLSVETLGICQLSESRLCAQGSLFPTPTPAPLPSVLGSRPSGVANRAIGPLAHPQAHHPGKPNPWSLRES